MKTGKDKAAMEDIQRRLAQQGIGAANIELYGGVDNTEKARGERGGGGGRPFGVAKKISTNTAPQASKSSLGPQVKSKSAVDAHNPVERHMAALKVAAAFRGKLARKRVDYEKRKISAVQKERQEEIDDRNRPRPSQLSRPKGKSYIGF
jgi:hypothetical protein